MRAIALFACTMALVLSGCSAGTYVHISSPIVTTSGVDITVDEEPVLGVHVETIGNDTVITWVDTGRTFTFRDKVGYEGRLELDSVDLSIAGDDVHIDRCWIRVRSVNGFMEEPLTDERFDGKNILVSNGRILAVK